VNSSFIITENTELKEKFLQLLKLLKSNGAYFDEDLRVFYEDNNLSIRSVGIKNQLKRYIEVPLELMPCIDEYEFSIKDDNLICTTICQTNETKTQIMMLMIDIFNLTSKISFQKQTSIFFNLKRHKDFVEYLLYSNGREKINRFLIFLKNDEYEKILIESFLGAREFNLKNQKDSALPSKRVILPIMDYLNHNIMAKGFEIDKQNNSMFVEALSTKESTQLFVCYNLYDALETLIIYGFSDTSTPLLFSIPMEISIGSGITIEIINIGFRRLEKNQVSENLLPIKDIIPDIQKITDNKIVLSKLAIPNIQFPLALKKVLHLMLNKLNIERTNEVRLPIIKAIEKQIVNQNLNYYNKLQEKLPEVLEDNEVSTYVKEQLQILTEHNIKHLKNYGLWFDNR